LSWNARAHWTHEDENPPVGLILKVFPNSPAAQADPSPGLIIRRIGDVPLECKGLAECMKLIRGNAGTKVPLELLDPRRKTKTVELTSQKILITR
jgi:C-terminal processing protease CtpA/Prc